jgi:isoleucyl-tRNA synthetase
MSKSEGNVIAPEKIIAKYGAELLRLWVSSVDYREDVRISGEIINRLVDAYRRIRNTCRYLLGNLYDFTPEKAVAFQDMDPLDRWALDRAAHAYARIQEAYESFEFHKVYHTLHNHCVTDLSALYLDILKDRLYASAADGTPRRSAQTALRHILFLLLRAMAPVLSFTAEEVLRHLPPALRPADATTVFALPPPEQAWLDALRMDETTRARWDMLLAIRAAVTRAVEPLRKDGRVGLSLDTHVCLYVNAETRGALNALGADARAVCMVSRLELLPWEQAPHEAIRPEELPGVVFTVEKARGDKCPRCWLDSAEFGAAPYPDLCPRCNAVLRDAG